MSKRPTLGEIAAEMVEQDRLVSLTQSEDGRILSHRCDWPETCPLCKRKVPRD